MELHSPNEVTAPGDAPPSLPCVTDNGFTLRRLCAADYDSNYMELLGQLTTAPPVSKATFADFVAAADANSAGHLVLVAEAPAQVPVSTADPPAAVQDGDGVAPAPPRPPLVIAATATLLVERKLVRGGASAAHIEDVVVCHEYRGSGLGRRMVGALTDEARRLGCYKVILDCAESNVEFYRRCGYATKEVQMALYF